MSNDLRIEKWDWMCHRGPAGPGAQHPRHGPEDGRRWGVRETSQTPAKGSPPLSFQRLYSFRISSRSTLQIEPPDPTSGETATYRPSGETL